MRRALPAVLNVLKAWALLVGVCALLGALGYAARGYRLLSILVFCALMVAAAAYWYADRVALGMVGARELPLGEAPALHSTVERLPSIAGATQPARYLTPGRPSRRLASICSSLRSGSTRPTGWPRASAALRTGLRTRRSGWSRRAGSSPSSR